MLFVIALIAVTSAVVLFYRYFTWNSNHWTKQGVPGPKPTFLIGSFPGEVYQTKHMIYEVDRIYNQYRGTTPFIGVFATTTPQLIITDPKVIRQCNVTEFKNFNSNDLSLRMDKSSDKLLGRHPFILTGDEWKAKRTEILPAFTMLKVKSMYPIVENVCVKMNTYLKRQTKIGQPFNAKELAAKFTIDVVACCIYGIDSESFTSDSCEIRDYGGQVLTPSTKVLSYFTAITVFPFLKKLLNLSFIEKHVENYFITLLNNAIRMRTESKIEQNDYLNFLMELKKKKNISELDMAAHTMAFFVDGFDTSSNVIAHVFYMLGMHKDVQQKLRMEINDAISKDGGITFENIQEMEYLDQVFNETLRLYPSGGLTKRRCTTATTLSDYNGKQINIKKDLIVIFPMWSIQRDPEYYTDPLKFDPDRFHSDNGGTKKYKEMGVFQPFGDGPRKCFGMRFGVIQSKAAIVEVIKNFDIRLNAKTKDNYVCVPKDILLQPIGGLWIDLKELPKINFST